MPKKIFTEDIEALCEEHFPGSLAESSVLVIQCAPSTLNERNLNKALRFIGSMKGLTAEEKSALQAAIQVAEDTPAEDGKATHESEPSNVSETERPSKSATPNR